MDALAIVTKPEPLTEAERMALTDNEGIISRGRAVFVDVLAAFSVIHDRHLYRMTNDTFAAYCADRWDLGKKRAEQMIRAHGVVAEIAAGAGLDPTDVDTVVSSGLVPTTERLARELIGVPEGQRAEAWEEAQDAAATEGKPVTAKHVRKAREKYTPVKERAPRKPKAEPKTMAEEVAEATARRLAEAPEPEPVPNAEPVVVDAETEPVEGKVVVFIRALALPDVAAVEGMTEGDLNEVRLFQAWCARVIGEYARMNLHVAA